MRKNAAFWCGIAFTLLLGSLLHFTYAWANKSLWVGLFSPVNESLWEHLKLLAVPYLLWAVIEFFLPGQRHPRYVPSKAASLLAGLLVLVVLYYAYTGIAGTHWLPADLALYVLSVFVAFVCDRRLRHAAWLRRQWAQAVGWAVLAALVALFVWWTLDPPHLPPFQDDATGQYGLGSYPSPAPHSARLR